MAGGARSWLAIAALVTVSACGTTLQRSTATSGTAEGLSAAGTPGSGSNVTVADGGQPGGGRGGVGTPGAARGVAGTPEGTGQDTSPVASDQPVTPRTAAAVKVGVVYLKGLDQAYKAAGGGKSNTTDSKADYEAVINDVNLHGGAAGRKLVASYFAIDASSTTAPATQLQSACAKFTQDEHVDVVLSYTVGSNSVLVSCLKTKGVPLVVGSSEADISAQTFSSDPLLWEPAEVSLDRLGQALPGYLVGHHWITGRWGSDARCATAGPRVGVVTFDQPDWHYAYDHDVAPAFKAAGHPVYDVAFLAISGNTASQLSQAAAAAQNAVLRFSNDCVDHVMFVSNVAVDYLFMNVAEQQQYNPRYGLSSLEAPPIIIQNLANPGPQLHGALALGWSPFSDVLMADYDQSAKAPGQHCLAVLQKAGVGPTDNNSAFLASPACEGPAFVASLFGRSFSSPGTLGAAANSLGTGYQPVGTFSARIDATRHDGASAFRDLAYVDACTCFRYQSAPQSW